jgi:hypothetical protein
MRRSQTRSNDFLLDFIFHDQYSEKNKMKTQIWHENLSFMLKRKKLKFAFEVSNANVFFFSIIKNRAQRKNVVIRCANERFRRCISLIASFICDYEEQMLIIDVKSEQHCIICRVSSKARKNLQDHWSLRTHKFMQEQIRRQQLEQLNSRNEKWIHEMKNFAWNYSSINIHEIMMIDILHQLFKNMMMHFLSWIQFLLKKKMSIKRKRREQTMRMTDLSDFDKLYVRFRKISSFIDLKIFQKFFEIKQWTKKEQKIIVRQIILIIIFLMIEKWFHAMNFTRVLIDFILIAQYKSHDDSTLNYLDHALFRFNAYKKIFRHSRFKEHEIEENHFNFFKFYAITHYVDFIKRYKVANEYDISHDETRHKYMIKKFYSRINKQEIFQTQLIEHNKRRLNILALKDLKRHMKKNSRSKKIEFTHTRANKNSLNLKLIKIISRSINQFSQRNSSQNSIHWCSIRKLDVKIRISDLTSIAIVFIREQRLKRTKESSNSRIRFQRESNSNWIMNYDVCLHESITCWIRKEHNFLNTKKLIKKKIRSKFDWQNQIQNWRRDYVWIRKEFFD